MTPFTSAMQFPFPISLSFPPSLSYACGVYGNIIPRIQCSLSFAPESGGKHNANDFSRHNVSLSQDQCAFDRMVTWYLELSFPLGRGCGSVTPLAKYVALSAGLRAVRANRLKQSHFFVFFHFFFFCQPEMRLILHFKLCFLRIFERVVSVVKPF